MLRQEFVAAHPPRLTVRRIGVAVDAWLTDSHRCPGVCVVNEGENNAVLEEAARTDTGLELFGNIVFYAGTTAPPYEPFEVGPKINPTIPGTWVPGQSGWWKTTDFDTVTLDQVREGADPDSKTKLYIIGRIHYMDVRGVMRETVFCRVYCKAMKRWTTSDFPEFEYTT